MPIGMPVDEMLLDLRSVLEEFEDDPCHDVFELIQAELNRIMSACEDLIMSK